VEVSDDCSTCPTCKKKVDVANELLELLKLGALNDKLALGSAKTQSGKMLYVVWVELTEPDNTPAWIPVAFLTDPESLEKVTLFDHEGGAIQMKPDTCIVGTDLKTRQPN
jgi:hypothetical protein